MKPAPKLEVRHDTFQGKPWTITREPGHDGVQHHFNRNAKGQTTSLETTWKKYGPAAGVPRATKLYEFQRWIVRR